MQIAIPAIAWVLSTGVGLASHTKVEVQPDQSGGLFYLMAAPYLVFLLSAAAVYIAYRRRA